MSNDGANAAAVRLQPGVVTIVPVTLNTQRIYPFQVRSVAIERIGAAVGHLPAAVASQLDEALRLDLSL